MVEKLTGTGVALVTPFRKYGTIDFSSLGNLINHVVANQVEYLVVHGTTGEAATLSFDEKNAVLNHVYEVVDGRVPIVVGVSGNNTHQVADDLKRLNLSQAVAVLSAAPYYNKPQNKGLYYHYKNIMAASPLPIILYNVPGRTGVNIPAEVTLQLAYDFDKIIAIKEASGNMGQITEIIKNKPDDFLVLSGDDPLTLPMIAMGAKGVISVTANVFPKQFSEMVRLALADDFDKARNIHYMLFDVMEALFLDGNPSGVKAALDILGLIQNNLRLPLVKVNKSVNAQIKRVVEEIA